MRRIAYLVALLVVLASAPLQAQQSVEALPERHTAKGLHVHFGPGSFSQSVSIADFSLEGPNTATMMPINRLTSTIAWDPNEKIYYARKSTSLGKLNPETGKVEVFEDYPKMSHMRGIAFSTKDRKLWVAYQHPGNGFLRYLKVDSGEWSNEIAIGGTRLHELEYHATEDMLYGLTGIEGADYFIRNLVQIDPNGTVVKTSKLSPPIPYFHQYGGFFQLKLFQDTGLIIVYAKETHSRLLTDRLYHIELSSGKVSQIKDPSKGNPVDDLWPGMPEGPAPSKNIIDFCSEGSYSQYKTPANLIDQQFEELHVIGVNRGDISAFQQIVQRIEKIEFAPKEVRVQLNLENKHSAVTVNVNPSKKPLTLVLTARDAILWTIKKQRGAKLERVILLGNKNQEIIDLPKGVELVNHATSDYWEDETMVNAYAWELEENTSEEFDKLIPHVRKLANMREASFQGCKSGKEFSVPY